MKNIFNLMRESVNEENSPENPGRTISDFCIPVKHCIWVSGMIQPIKRLNCQKQNLLLNAKQGTDLSGMLVLTLKPNGQQNDIGLSLSNTYIMNNCVSQWIYMCMKYALQSNSSTQVWELEYVCFYSTCWWQYFEWSTGTKGISSK